MPTAATTQFLGISIKALIPSKIYKTKVKLLSSWITSKTKTFSILCQSFPIKGTVTIKHTQFAISHFLAFLHTENYFVKSRRDL